MPWLCLTSLALTDLVLPAAVSVVAFEWRASGWGVPIGLARFSTVGFELLGHLGGLPVFFAAAAAAAAAVGA